MGSGLFVAFEGIDGSGKSTTAARLVARLRVAGVPATLIEHNSTALGDPAVSSYAAELIALKETTHSFDYAALGALHWALIRASYYALVDRFAIGPALDRGEVAVADGWYHKFIARLVAAGHATGADSLAEVFAPIRVPDVVVLLDTPPPIAAARKKRFNSAEYGPRGADANPHDSFVGYQSQVRAQLLRMATDLGWHVLRTRTEVPDHVAARAQAALERGTAARLAGTRRHERRLHRAR